MSNAPEGNLFKCYRASCQFVALEGDVLVFTPHPAGGSKFITQREDYILELTEASKHRGTGIYIDPEEPMAFTAEAVQDAFKRKIIEDFLANQNLNPANSSYTTTNETGISASSSESILGVTVGGIPAATKSIPLVAVKS
jgi:hypothetical protein